MTTTLCTHPYVVICSITFVLTMQTLKLWNLQKTIPAKKSASLDVEPVYTFRAHRGAVLSLDVAPAGDYVFSGGQDSTIRVWNMPNPNIDPYDAFDPSVLAATLTGKCFFTLYRIHQLSNNHSSPMSPSPTASSWTPPGLLQQ